MLEQQTNDNVHFSSIESDEDDRTNVIKAIEFLFDDNALKNIWIELMNAVDPQ